MWSPLVPLNSFPVRAEVLLFVSYRDPAPPTSEAKPEHLFPLWCKIPSCWAALRASPGTQALSSWSLSTPWMFCWLASCRVCQGHVSLPSSRMWGKSGEGTARRAETRSCARVSLRGPGVGERACDCSWPHGGMGSVVLAWAATEGLLLLEDGAPGGWHVTRSPCLCVGHFRKRQPQWTAASDQSATDWLEELRVQRRENPPRKGSQRPRWETLIRDWVDGRFANV